MSYPTTPATFPTHVTGEIVSAAHVNAYAAEIEAVETAWLSPYGQTFAPFRVRGAPPGVEFGDGNAAGGASMLGHWSAAGSGLVGFHMEPGTTSNTFKTRGIPGLMIAGNAGHTGLYVASVPTAAADNQNVTVIMTASPEGCLAFPGCMVCRLRMTAPPSVTASVLTTLAFDTEDADPLAMHAPGGATITIPTAAAGWYLMTASTRFAPQSNGYRQLAFYVNGVATALTQIKGLGNTLSSNLCLTWIAPLQVGDVVDVRVYHTSVAPLVVGDTAREQQSQFALVKVA